MSRPTKLARTLEKVEELFRLADSSAECAVKSGVVLEEIRDILNTPVKPKTCIPIEPVIQVQVPPIVAIKDSPKKLDPEYTCICGKVLTSSSRKRHEKSNSHLKFLKESTDEDSFVNLA